jgi:hypothetical protein
MTYRAECLELALTVTKGRRGNDTFEIAEMYAGYATDEKRLQALTMAINHPGEGDIIATADRYLEFFDSKPVEKNPAPAMEAKTTGQAARPRKTRRKAGARKGA